MTDRPLLVFDFDGVIVDGMAEYWWSAWTAADGLGAAPQGLTPTGSTRSARWEPSSSRNWEAVASSCPGSPPAMTGCSWSVGQACNHPSVNAIRSAWLRVTAVQNGSLSSGSSGEKVQGEGSVNRHAFGNVSAADTSRGTSPPRRHPASREKRST